ncbi:dihydrolipoyl dehydrogenase [Mycolicibacterium confluentis]|uniref:Dihydrolipoyl dehydrogenase n=1 Tax=Mycolicibacterium confluentis TaxID=28047 RepID=A0A7I7Y2I0_9MYCO|nr:dihydrolipoyl dehydrogenase [Mycolicibacterium confluentis]MCV7320732.1 dihydrolipoyl dehydrogenase [Mycolicibacterium confluentis]ORV30365.1 dihydrolipoamide dehydrogenase [Mycolicibacterium confluentis]BBZ35779.1 dihydrolipoyl dehydrogenase [Mycolicibacterium confluentis]
MTTQKNSDVLILGGGPAGYSCALRASQLGLSVTLIEADRLGGTCLHRGCIPTKALLHTAEVADTTRAAVDVGVRARFDGVDMAAAQAYKNAVVTRLHRGLEGLVTSRKVTVVTGTGRYLGGRRVEVDGAVLSGDAVVLATGSTPRQVPELAFGGRILRSDEALELTDVPRTALVVGGGVIGVEFASLWTSLGSSVTVVESLPRLLAGEDAWASDILQRTLRGRGVTVRTGITITGATQTEDGVTVGTEDGDTMTAEVVLVAAGREPRSQALAEAGIAVHRGFVRVDARLESNHPGVYAIGDLVAGHQLAHRGFAHGIFVAEVIAGRDPVPVTEHLIPRITYSHPEVASVGLTETAARAEYGEVTTTVYGLSGNGRSQILRTSGGIKVIRRGPADADGPVVGIHCVGDRVGELIGEAQLIVGWEATPADVRPHLHAHPTQNEALGEALLAMSGAPLHTHS